MEVTRNPTDSELIEGLKGERTTDQAIRILYRNYYEPLSWYVINNSGSAQDAEDIFQEVVIAFVDLVRKNRFRGESSVKTFLFSMNRHYWLNELKRRGRALAREEKFERMQDRTTVDAGVKMVGLETGKEIMKLLDQLGETCKKILLLYYYEDYSMKQILEQVPYENEQVVRNKKYKCIKQLEQNINDNPPLKQALKSILHG
jgi:RNA polymerase sigma factor (sigma-70 family)